MKYTLLELTQNIASSMDSDDISTILESVESKQIVNVIKTAYYDLVTRAKLPEHYSMKNLTESTDTLQPVIMTIPSDVAEIKWVKYDNASLTDTDVQMHLVEYLPIQSFMDRMDLMDETGANIDSFTYTTSNGDTFKILYWNDRHPRYYSSIDDSTLIFDSYDNTVDTILTSSKTRAYCRLTIPWTESDSFTPSLDDNQFALLLNEAKALAWTELKQSAHPKAEQNARRGWANLNKNKYTTETGSDFDQLPYFGRR